MSVDLANGVTVARIASLAPIAAVLLLRSPEGDALAALLFGLAAATDWLDGRIARARAGSRSAAARSFGRMLDPIADKLLVASILLLLAGTGRLGDAGLVPGLVILAREVLVAGLREHVAGLGQGQPALPVTRLAKWKTGAQMAALVLLTLGDQGAARIGLGFVPVHALGLGSLWVAAFLTSVTGWRYLEATLRLSRAAAPGSGGR